MNDAWQRLFDLDGHLGAQPPPTSRRMVATISSASAWPFACVRLRHSAAKVHVSGTPLRIIPPGMMPTLAVVSRSSRPSVQRGDRARGGLDGVDALFRLHAGVGGLALHGHVDGEVGGPARDDGVERVVVEQEAARRRELAEVQAA